MSSVIVVGGGAAGMMAAVAAGRRGHRVTLLEKNEKLGKKIYITGKGRCNFTNACDVEQLFGAVVSNPKFLYSAIYGFDNSMTMEFFREMGMPWKVERGNRVFPVSDHSSDVTKALERAMDQAGVKVLLQTEVKDIRTHSEPMRLSSLREEFPIPPRDPPETGMGGRSGWATDWWIRVRRWYPWLLWRTIFPPCRDYLCAM